MVEAVRGHREQPTPGANPVSVAGVAYGEGMDLALIDGVTTGETCDTCGLEIVLRRAGDDVLLECGCGDTTALA